MTTLRSLEKYDGLTATNILASLVLAQDGPGVGAAAANYGYEQERVEVLDELKSRLNLASLEWDDARLKLLQEITRQLYALSMAGKDTEAVLARAGASGRLLPSLYRVEFNPTFQAFVALGTKINHVTDAVLRPDGMQHFSGKDGELSFSIITKFQPGKHGAPGFWLIVYAHRVDRILVVQNAWRAYVDDVDLEGGMEPVDLLRAFVNKFGMEIHSGAQTSRFIFNSDVPVPPGTMVPVNKIKNTTGKYVYNTISSYDLPGVHRVVIAFAIDLGRYEASLSAHGVQTRMIALPTTHNEVVVSAAHVSGGTRFRWSG